MSSWVPRRTTPGTEEVRLATTLTGGLSLAVWMGGVARELDLVQQASRLRDGAPGPAPADVQATADVLTAAERRERDLYGRLLDLLDVVVDTDVLSGTSAGGINAVLLALARVRGCDLGPLRDTWLDLGALLGLLRDPADADVPSLLAGDAAVYAHLVALLRGMTAAPVPTSTPSTTLYVTTTLLTPESARFVDDMGTSVQDADRHGVLTFTEDHLADPGVADALALAARSTSAFPGAFEPSYVPAVGGVPAQGKVPARPAMLPYAAVTRGHWAVDGGLLDNQPLDLVLQRVFDRRASRRVRRIMLFVVPTTGPAPDLLRPAPSDDPGDPYGLLGALMHDVEAVTSQSITASLRAVADHDDQAAARVDLRRTLARTVARLWPCRLFADDADLFEGFVAREVDRVARPLVTAATRILSTWSPATPRDPVGIPPQWEDALRTGGAGSALLGRGVRDALAAPLRAAGVPRAVTDLPAAGRDVLDEAKSLVVQLLRDAYDAAAPGPAGEAARAAVTGHLAHVHEAVPMLRAPSAMTDARSARDRVDPFTLVRACLEDAVVGGSRGASLDEVAVAVARAWEAADAVDAAPWRGLATVLVDAADVLAAGATATNAVATYLVALGLRPPSLVPTTCFPGVGEALPLPLDASQDAVSDADTVAVRLFDLVAAELALLPPEAGPLQRAGLVQVSADTRSALAPSRSTAARKLTGLQLHHFGAFYKRSWRQNDWMWGRLDGAGWLVHVLLSPARLAVVAAAGAAGTGASPAAWATGELARLAGTGTVPADVADELAYLDHVGEPGGVCPQHLGTTSLWLARAWQHEVVADELPRLADEVLGTPEGAAVDKSPGRTRTWAQKVRAAAPGGVPGASLDALLDECPVADETFASDRGTPLMVSTVTKAAATAVAAVDSVHGIPGPARPAVTTARTVALAGYRVTAATRGAVKAVLLVGLALLVVGGALTTVTSDVVGVPMLVVALAGAYLVTVGAWQWSRRLVGALVSVTLGAAIVALAVPWVRDLLFGDGTAADHGFVGDRGGGVLEWLADAWWHPLAAVAGVLVVLCVVAALLSTLGPGRSRRPKSGPAVPPAPTA
ncbi:patatin-like protein [Luteimicrobium subarcticum]|uniref:Patatin-related protein n=1 Tax=Luteimicrobium subarcticum TaxID=620910 RepID=A0A2M8WR26_9MICO|nr:patatin-like protein [Luteimicrobium subarcticum]PJI93383.1 patatin-related protein [Luteimicrobium subarcticum]